MIGTKSKNRAAAVACVFVATAWAPVVAGAQSATANRVTQIEVQAVVNDPTTATAQLVEWLTLVGGFYVYRAADRIDLRVPRAVVQQIRPEIEAAVTRVVAFNPTNSDIGQELVQVRAGIVAREESLAKITDYLADADLRSTLAFERELIRLMTEVEQLMGRERLLNDRLAYARVTVLLSTTAHEAPQTVPTAFAWVNSLGLYQFVQETRR